MRARTPESSKLPNSPTWHALYRAALFEDDPHKILDRILRAERVLIQRARELFIGSKDKFQERQAIEDALYTLSALRDRLGSKAFKH
jgi:hypothetical protein